MVCCCVAVRLLRCFVFVSFCTLECVSMHVFVIVGVLLCVFVCLLFVVVVCVVFVRFLNE